MIINEIIQIDRNNEPDSPIKQLPQTPVGYRLPLVGHGHEALVYKHPTDPHMVIRVEKIYQKDENNGYYQWCKELEDLQGSNPYLPRVYGIYDVDRKGDNVKHAYVLEKLSDPRALLQGPITKKTLYSFLEQIFGESLADELWKSYATGRSDIGSIWGDMSDFITRMISQPTRFEDEKFTEAANIIRKLIKKGFTNDLYAENIMIRLTPVGPQLVLIDPIVM